MPDQKKRRQAQTVSHSRPAVKNRKQPPAHTRPGVQPSGRRNPAAGNQLKRPPQRRSQAVNRRPPPAGVKRPENRERAAAIQSVQRKRRKHHKRNYTLYYIILFFFLSVTGIVLSLTVFFNIKTITVGGSQAYSQTEILSLLNVKVGDNLLRIDTGKMETELLDALPQADYVEISRSFPSGLIVTVTDGVPSAQLSVDGQYYIISQSGRILEKSPEAKEGCGVVVCGVSLQDASVGDYLEDVQQRNWEEASALAKENDEEPPEKPRDLQNLQALFNALRAVEFSDINAVDITDEVALTVYWQNRIKIQLGSFSELEYKLRFVKKILTDEAYKEIILPDSIGVLDAQSASSVLPFQPLSELEVPGGGVGLWNWDDGLEEVEPTESSESSDNLFEPGSDDTPEPSLDSSSEPSSDLTGSESADPADENSTEDSDSTQ